MDLHKPEKNPMWGQTDYPVYNEHARIRDRLGCELLNHPEQTLAVNSYHS